MVAQTILRSGGGPRSEILRLSTPPDGAVDDKAAIKGSELNYLKLRLDN